MGVEMAQYTTEAILLAVKNYGEADKMVTFLSRDLGKVAAAAYGCRRPRSQLAGGMQVFSHLRLTLTEGTSLDAVRQCETKTSFKGLREDLACMAYASFLAELAAQICPERHPEPEIFDLLLRAYALMQRKNPRIAALAAAYQMLELTGSQPEYGHCVICGRTVLEDAHFSLEKSGVICGACKMENVMAFPVKTQAFVRDLIALDWEKPAAFRVHGSDLMQAEKLMIGYLLHLIEKPLKSLDFIRDLTALPAAKKIDNA